MDQFTGVKREAKGFYGIFINGERVTCASNPAKAKEKLNKELDRHAMNAEREASTAMWNAARAEREYSFAERIGTVTA